MDSFPCPKGCGRDDFKSKSAAGAHAVHCKFEPEPGIDPPSDGLNPSEQLIVDKVIEAILPQIKEGMAGLQETIRTNILNSLESVVAPMVAPMVAQETVAMAGKIAEEVKKNPNAGLLGSLDQINLFLETPFGKMVQGWIGSKTGGSKVSMHALSRGMSTAERMLLSKKTDFGRMAEVILVAAESELKDRKLDGESRDFMIGMKNTAKIAIAGMAKEEEKGGGE